MSRRARGGGRAGAAPRTASTSAAELARAATTARARWPFALIPAAAVLAYGNALGHPFLFDDVSGIVDNPTIRTLGASLRGGLPQMPTAGRPIVNVSFALNYLVDGLVPWGYHAVNLGVHIACALVLFALVRRMLALPRLAAWSPGRDTGLAAAVTLLWVVHPLTSEIVNYATQRTEALMALAFLGTLYGGVRALTSPGARAWQALSIAACAIGMACKESMATAPVVMLLLDSTCTGTTPLAALRKRPVYYAGLAATWAVLALLVVEGPRWRSAGFTSGVSPWTYLLEQAPMIARYLRLVFVPTGLVLDYGQPVARTLTSVLPAGALVVLLLVATAAAWRLAPVLGFLGTWFFMTLAPTSSVLPIATEVGAERRMYLPLIAVLMMLALAAARLLARIDDPRVRTRVATLGTGLLCVLLAAATIIRNREYDSSLHIWQTVVERRPHGRAHYNYGHELKAAGRRADALAEYERALPDQPDAHYAIGFELQADGRNQEALDHYRAFVRLKPDDVTVPRTYHQIGRTLQALGRREEAVVAFRDALARKRGDLDSLGGLADTLLGLERLTDAAATYQEYLRLKPDSPDAMMNLGIVLVRMDRDAEARDQFARLVQLQPANVGAHVNLAYAMANTGRYGESLQEFRRAVELEKDPAARAEIESAITQLLGSH